MLIMFNEFYDMNTGRYYIKEILDDFHGLVTKAKTFGLDIKLTPNSNSSLKLYFNDDYPDTILVDKEENGM